MNVFEKLKESKIKYTVVPMLYSQRETISYIHRERLKVFRNFCPAILFVCIYAASLAFTRARKMLISEYGEMPNFLYYYAIICLLISIFWMILIYRFTVSPFKKDLDKGTVLRIEAKVIVKSHFEYVDKYYIECDTPIFNKFEVSAEEFNQFKHQSIIPLYVAPYSQHLFNKLGKYYLM